MTTTTQQDDDVKKTSSPTHFRRTSSVRLSKDWLDQIHDAPAAVTGSTCSGVGVGAAATGADDEDYPDDEKGGGGGGGGGERTLFPSSAKNKAEPTTNNKETTVESQAQDDVVVLLDKIAFFPLPNDVPESPITTSNRKRLSSFGGGGVGGGDGVAPELSVPVLSTVTSAAEMTATTGDDDAAALPAQAEDSANEVISSPKEQQDALLLNLQDGYDGNDKTSVDDDDDDDEDDDIGRSTHSELTAGGIWEDVPMAAPDDILGIAQNYRECTEPNKVNVCVGAYRDEHGRPWVLPSVREAERRLMNDEKEDMEYLPIEGDRDFIDCAMRFAYGHEMNVNQHLAAVQTLSGTGACRIGGAFLAKFWPHHPIYIPDPTWGNHVTIFRECGLDVRRYRYYDKKTNGLDMRGMMKDLNRAPDGSIVLFHACAHNPTGCDPTIEDWKKIVKMVHRKEHVVFFDSAYQGFASGNAEKDAEPFRYAVSQHIPILLAQSFAKNFGLYGERVGTLSIVCGDVEQKQRILSELRIIIRPMYSSPPKHGSSIIKTILSDGVLQAQYRLECAKMAARIQDMRAKLVVKLQEAGSVHDWSHITQQIGMFAFTGLNADMCQTLTQEYFIFLTTNGRISIAGLNDGNIEYVAQAVHAVSHGKSITATA